jgi:putative transposase
MKARRAMIQVMPSISMRRQCELLQVCRASVYYEPAATNPDQLELMRRIDELHLKYPFYGSRKLARCLKSEGKDVNRKQVQRLMRLMDIEGMAPKADTSRPAPAHPTYPYLLRNVKVCRVDQVWCADVTYIPMAHGFVYLMAVMDWYSRRVLAWRVSNTLDTAFCIEALEEALSSFGKPEIFNTDQGAQFTAEAFTSVLHGHDVKISMDGKGRYIDNIFVERLWRSVKYEEVYLHAYESVSEARTALGRYFDFYNRDRPHQALGYQTPEAFHRGLQQAA